MAEESSSNGEGAFGKIFSFAEGSIVALKEGDNLVDFYVSKHNYENGLNGFGRTLFVRKDCYADRMWGDFEYSNSVIDNWLNSTYKALLDPSIQDLMGTTKFYYTPGQKLAAVTTLERSIFIPSGTELNYSYKYYNNEGSPLPIASVLRNGYGNGSTITMWTRTPAVASNAVGKLILYFGGTYGEDGNFGSNFHGARPCFTLPEAAYVYPDGTVALNPPPASITVPDSITIGETLTVSWEPVDGATKYILEKKADDGDWLPLSVQTETAYTQANFQTFHYPTIQLQWRKTDEYWAGAKIVKKLGSAQQRFRDGEMIYDGNGEEFFDEAVEFSTDYYYRIYPYNAKGQLQTEYNVTNVLPIEKFKVADLPCGTKIRAMYGDMPFNLIVVQHGIPPESSLEKEPYDATFNGTWVISDKTFGKTTFCEGTSTYRNTPLKSKLDNVYANLDEVTRNNIRTVNRKCYTATINTNTASVKLFPMAIGEMNGNSGDVGEYGWPVPYICQNIMSILSVTDIDGTDVTPLGHWSQSTNGGSSTRYAAYFRNSYYSTTKTESEQHYARFMAVLEDSAQVTGNANEDGSLNWFVP